MNEKFKTLILFLDEKGLVELYHICKIRYFELYIEDNFEYANRYNDICIAIRQELVNRNIWNK